MTIEEIVRGESRNVEFKVTLPKESEKYTKSVVAFAKSQGGKLIFGVDDKTREVAGVDEDELFRMMDSISNAISDSCRPQIVPNIEPQTVDAKTVIVVTVTPGANRPYYLKSKGKDKGTFIRVAGTSRPAYPEKVKELELEGARIYWDELTCIGYEVTDEMVKKLCDDILRFRNKMGLPKRDVTLTQLINWKLLKKENDSLMASNAFALMTSDYFSFSKTQCAVFRGTERTVFLDKREFSGPIYEQIVEATDFVLRNIRLGATIDGLVRKESYELPLEAIREMIINAHCHRNLMDDSCIQVAIYDDRLEVTSPGGLYNGLTYEELMNGHSKIRNRAIANVFNKMGLVESWGTGVKRILCAARDYGLPTPSFQVFDDMFRVNLFRNVFPLKEQKYVEEASEEHRRSIGEALEKHRRNNEKTMEKQQGDSREDLSGTQKQILELLSKDTRISAKKMAEIIGISSRNIEANIRKLKKCGILVRHGSPKNGYWEIV
ncbi:MAG: winged helix-turn-helix transcriptional regulator [Ruminococcus sp.]|nr:winged helix-turn-helix transcriptional regulator [Ruminococcus sp.]